MLDALCHNDAANAAVDDFCRALGDDFPSLDALTRGVLAAMLYDSSTSNRRALLYALAGHLGSCCTLQAAVERLEHNPDAFSSNELVAEFLDGATRVALGAS